MIIDKKIEVIISSKNCKYYSRKIKKKLFVGDKINISPDILPETSKNKINVKCDICGKEKKISMYSYRRNINNYKYYACSQTCASNKSKNTNLKRYGKNSFTQTDEYIIKTKKTKKEKYGDEKYVNVDKIKQTCLERYGEESYMKTKEFKIKSKKVNIDKYGVEYPLQSEKFLNKFKKTNLKKYGFEFSSQNDNVKKKILKTKKLRYGDSNYNNRDKFKVTCLELFGVDNPMKNENIKEKLKNIIFDKYGVFYPSQNPEILEKMLKNGYKIKKYRDTDLYYQGTYEKDFLDRYYDNIEISRGKYVEYYYNNTKHFYFPDFFIKKLNLIVEIKSSKWYEEHKQKNILKEKACKKSGYNFIFIIDKDYDIFDKMIESIVYDKKHSWQYDIRLKYNKLDTQYLEEKNIDSKKIKISDFKFEFIKKDDNRVKDISKFIKKYEWLGTMPNRPTHRFIMSYDGIIGGVLVMSIPNSFSKILGDDTKNIEKLISRGACASWTPKNLASSLLMKSINWMVKNTEFRVFTAYADSEAKELGTIYQASNFIYIGKKYGSTKLYFDPLNSHLSWTSGRNYTKLNFYKSYLKKLNIKWDNNWNRKTKILWDKIPKGIVKIMKDYSKECKDRCIVRKVEPKHKYLYILGEDNRETKKLRKKFMELNPDLIDINYPKKR